MTEEAKRYCGAWINNQPSLFPWLEEELDPLTAKLEGLIIILDTLGLDAFVAPPPGGRGRAPEDRPAIARAFVAKTVLNLPTTAALIERLHVDRSLRRICGWECRAQVPSEATFSRAFAEFADQRLPERVHEQLVREGLRDPIIGHVARDATEIEAREKPPRRPPDAPPPQAPGTAASADAGGHARRAADRLRHRDQAQQQRLCRNLDRLQVAPRRQRRHGADRRRAHRRLDPRQPGRHPADAAEPAARGLALRCHGFRL